jgi:hypothetical protein
MGGNVWGAIGITISLALVNERYNLWKASIMAQKVRESIIGFRLY